MKSEKKDYSQKKCTSQTNEDIDRWCKSIYEKYKWENLDESRIDRDVITDYSKKKQYSDIQFDAAYYWYCWNEIEENLLGNQLDTQKSSSYDNRVIEEVREIKDLTTTYHIAVKWKGDDKYYLYCSMDYKPDSLKQYMKDAGIEQFETFYQVYIHVENDQQETEHTIVYLDEVEKLMENYIFNYDERYMGQSDDVCGLQLVIMIPELNKSIVLTFTSDNALVISDGDNFQNYKFGFGEDKIKDIEEYIESHMKGYYLPKGEPDGITPTVLHH